MPSHGLHEQAADSIAFIRATMARSAEFTAVPGWGGVAMGLVGLSAGVAGSLTPNWGVWLNVWLGAAIVAGGSGLSAMHLKARRHRVALWSASGRRFAQGFFPALAAGAIMTFVLVQAEAFALLPGMWLLLYGAGVLAGATASVPLLTWLGAGMMALGVVSSLTRSAGDLWLAAGFGGLHIIFGFIIARKHGG